MKSIFQAFFTRVFIPFTTTLIFTIAWFVIVSKTDEKERAILLLLIGYFWMLVLGIVLVGINFLLLKLLNPVYDFTLRNDIISVISIFFALYFLITSDDNYSGITAVFFLLANLIVIFYCKKKKVM